MSGKGSVPLGRLQGSGKARDSEGNFRHFISSQSAEPPATYRRTVFGGFWDGPHTRRRAVLAEIRRAKSRGEEVSHLECASPLALWQGGGALQQMRIRKRRRP